MQGIEKALQALEPGEKLQRGSQESAVATLQQYLLKYGFLAPEFSGRETLLERVALSLDHALGTPKGEFDGRTADALQKAQKFYGLPQTGVLDEETLKLLTLPRYDHHPDASQFVIAATWDHTELTYRFDNASSKLPAPDAQDAVHQAFQTWQSVSRLTFREVGIGQAADIDVLWATGNHGDGNAFDGPLGVLAHGYFPPPRGGSIPGDLHFDDDETWSVDPSSLLSNGFIDLTTVAAHEIGHCLGLDHSHDRDALMFPFYGGPRRDPGDPIQARLGSDDVQGIRSMYP